MLFKVLMLGLGGEGEEGRKGEKFVVVSSLHVVYAGNSFNQERY